MSVYCLAGTSFELEVNSAETGWEVAERITTLHAGLLVLTSGGCVIDQCQLLLHQVRHGEIWYVVQEAWRGPCRDALGVPTREEDTVRCSWLSETMSLTWYSSQKQHNQGIQLPSSLQSLSFGDRFILGGHPATQQPAELDGWRPVQPRLGGHPTTQQPAEFDVWPRVQPELGGHPVTQQPAKFEVWPRAQPEFGGHNPNPKV